MAGTVPAPTERLIFRTWVDESDSALAAALWGDSRVTEFIGGPFNDAAVVARLEAECQSYKDEGVQYWPVFLSDAESDNGFGAHVGAVGLRRYSGNAPSCIGLSSVFEIGFHLRPEHWGHGLATEAAAAVLQFAFVELNVDAIFVGHNPHNKKSARALSKLGFTFTHEEYYPPTGLMHPSYIMKTYRSRSEGTGRDNATM